MELFMVSRKPMQSIQNNADASIDLHPSCIPTYPTKARHKQQLTNVPAHKMQPFQHLC
jgi:hypothetical protein